MSRALHGQGVRSPTGQFHLLEEGLLPMQLLSLTGVVEQLQSWYDSFQRWPPFHADPVEMKQQLDTILGEKMRVLRRTTVLFCT